MFNETLMNRLKKYGINKDKIVYSVCIEDIVQVIADVFEDKALSLSDDEIDELIKKGTKGLENGLLWYETIEIAIES